VSTESNLASGAPEPADRPAEQPAAPEPAHAPPVAAQPELQGPPAPASQPAAPAEPVGAGKPADSPAPPKKRRRRKKKSPRPEQADRPPAAKPAPGARGRRPKSSRPEHSALRAVRALSEMAQNLLEVDGVDPLARPRYMNIELRVPLDPRDGAKSASAAVEQILKRVREVREHERALSPGAVYCYFHESADAPTSRPTECRQVFDGYGSTGRPEFTDFVTMAIERRDAGVDELLAGADVIVTHVSIGRVLRTQQLAEFGKSSPVYRILGQVDAGLYARLSSDEKAAFSFQLLRGSTLEGKPRFRLHAVGAVPLSDIADSAVAQILSRYQRRLDRESLRFAGLVANGDAPDEEDFVLPILQNLAKDLSGRARRAGRRTGHAAKRVDEGQRPTAKAFEDAQAASDEAILRDDSEGTFVVLGPRGRVHVFAPDARHVTSLIMDGRSVQKRRSDARWRPAEPAERGELRIRLGRRIAGGETVADDAVPPGPEPATTGAGDADGEPARAGRPRRRRGRRQNQPSPPSEAPPERETAAPDEATTPEKPASPDESAPPDESAGPDTDAPAKEARAPESPGVPGDEAVPPPAVDPPSEPALEHRQNDDHVDHGP
jgi:hypothetical protein